MSGQSLPRLDSPEGVLEYISYITHNPGKVQQEVLASILKENAHCQYLARYGLDGRTDVESFKSCVPLSDYESIKEDLYRIADGENTEESPILCSGRIVELHTSSGTSGGERKFYPTVESDSLRKMVFSSVTSVVTTLAYPDLAKGGKGLYFYGVRPAEETRSGLVAQPVTASLLRSIFSGRGPLASFAKTVTSPGEVILTPEKDNQMLYCHWLCGLVQFKEVVRIGSLFAPSLARALQYLEKSWQQLCWDIRQGKLDDSVQDPAVREAVERLMGGPNPELADRVKSICSGRTKWDGIIAELWPNMILAESIVTGSMAAYLPLLRGYLGNIPIVSMTYASSEGFLGTNLRPTCPPEDVAYTLLPFMMYFEFLPITEDVGQADEQASVHSESDSTEGSDHATRTVDITGVKLGKLYEVVVTTHAGLYRYRMEDCLRVARFYNHIPEFQFVERRNLILSVDTDKTTESELLAAVGAGAVLLKQRKSITITDYSSYVDVSTTPGRYVIFWELSHQEVPQSVLEQCCEKLENSLGFTYRRNRNEGFIAPLTLRVVESGTFDLLLAAAVARGATHSQYKTPRCLKATADVVLFNSRTVMEVSSPTLPSLKAFGA